jgi:hypothetical protein
MRVPYINYLSRTLPLKVFLYEFGYLVRYKERLALYSVHMSNILHDVIIYFIRFT